MSAVRARSTLRDASIGPRGSMTTDMVRRTSDDNRRGPRKSGPASVRGHSATQYVACQVPSTRRRLHSPTTPRGHGHSSSVERSPATCPRVGGVVPGSYAELSLDRAQCGCRRRHERRRRASLVTTRRPRRLELGQSSTQCGDTHAAGPSMRPDPLRPLPSRRAPARHRAPARCSLPAEPHDGAPRAPRLRPTLGTKHGRVVSGTL